MIVRRAEVLGMCSGVRRAIRLAEKTLAENPGVPVWSLGPLVHNPDVVEGLRARGLRPVEDASRVTGGIVVLRAHGVGPSVRAACARPGLSCVDATCPDVLRVHALAREQAARGGRLYVVGDPDHAEVRGIAEHASDVIVVSSVEEARSVPAAAGSLAVAQTTVARPRYEQVCAALRARMPDLRAADTTCAATERRTESLLRLAAEVDAVLVVGGRNSANTARLAEAVRAMGKPCWHIEGAAEIPADIGKYGSVGIGAGASTPDSVIEEVEARLRTL
jgi:(E)-4-hydroxy-3-methyl-but-2-enyl pyrophosphate reductase